MIKFKGKVIVERPLVDGYFDYGWDNDMYQHYPKVKYCYMENGDIVLKTIHLGEYYDGMSKDLEIISDEAQVKEHKAYEDRLEYEKDFQQIKKNRIVEVIRGRKIPIGTQAKVFWVGQTKYGMSCGLELANGNKVFTSYHNLKVIAM